jgi:hypothetical protein
MENGNDSKSNKTASEQESNTTISDLHHVMKATGELQA